MPQARGLRSLFALVAVVLGASCSDATEPAPEPEPEPTGMACGMAGEQVLVLQETAIKDCDWIRGSLHVPDWFLPTLPFERLQRVEEKLSFFRPHHLRDFRGLDRLEKVGGEFSIRLDNAGELVALDGLEALREVGSLTIDGNAGLADLSGLAGLETVRGDVKITGNPSLPAAQIKALMSHIRVQGMVDVSDNKP